MSCFLVGKAWPSSGWDDVWVSNDDDHDCVEHVWQMAGMSTAADGTHIDYQCVRCGAVMLEGPDELAGRVG